MDITYSPMKPIKNNWREPKKKTHNIRGAIPKGIKDKNHLCLWVKVFS
jgi:hypothetical protein